MPHFENFVSLPIFRNSVVDWTMASATVLATLLVLLLGRRLLRWYRSRLLATDRIEFLEVPIEALTRTTVVFFVGNSNGWELNSPIRHRD